MGEELVMHWSKVYKLKVISLRFFNLYGPRSRTSGTYGAMFGTFLAQKISGLPFTIVGNGNQKRDFTYVTDAVGAIVKASKSNINGEIFNVGSGNSISVNYIVKQLKGKKIFIPKRPGEPDKTFAPVSTFIPGTAFDDEINSGIVFFKFVVCLIVSSYKITPPIHFFILSDEKSVSLNISLFSGVDSTFTALSLLVIVPVLSSVARIPFPFDKIFKAMLFKSDILI